MNIKTLFASSLVAASLFGATQPAFAAEILTPDTSQEIKTTNPEVKKLYERYSQSKIGDRVEKHGNWHFSQQPVKSNQVRLNLQGTYHIGANAYHPKRHVTLDKGKITLKELDHIVRYAHVSYGLYESDTLPQGKIVIHTKDHNFYTLEVHKPLQSHRENVEINIEDLTHITYDIQA